MSRSSDGCNHSTCSLFTLRWWEKVLWLSQITFRPIPLSRSDPFPGLNDQMAGSVRFEARRSWFS
jgi:hypothetical protein